MRLDHDLVAAHDPLMQRDRSAPHLLRLRHDLEHVVHAGRLQELDLHRAHDKGEARRLRSVSSNSAR